MNELFRSKRQNILVWQTALRILLCVHTFGLCLPCIVFILSVCFDCWRFAWQWWTFCGAVAVLCIRAHSHLARCNVYGFTYTISCSMYISDEEPCALKYAFFLFFFFLVLCRFVSQLVASVASIRKFFCWYLTCAQVFPCGMDVRCITQLKQYVLQWNTYGNRYSISVLNRVEQQFLLVRLKRCAFEAGFFNLFFLIFCKRRHRIRT